MSGILEHSPANVLRVLLIELGYGTNPVAKQDWPFYDSNETSAPDQCVTLYDTAGRYDGREMRDGEKYEFHGVQIRVRGVNHTDAWVKANALAMVLDREVCRNQVVVGSSTYMIYSASRVSGPMSLGREPETNRVLFTINAVVVIRQIT